MQNSTQLPRMRSIAGALEELKELDPNTAITQNQIRCMVKENRFPYVRAGKRILINFDMFLNYLSSETYQVGQDAEKPQQAYGKLRQVAE